MKKTTAGFWDRLFIKTKNIVDRVLYYDNLFDDNVWKIRFSRDNRKKLKYQIEKSNFTLAYNGIDDMYKYLWGLLLIATLVGMLVLTRNIGISDREVAQHEYSEMLYNHFHHLGDEDTYKGHPYAKTQAQTPDLLIYSAAKLFRIDNVYAIRHIVSAVFGWLLVAYLSLILLRAFSWRAAFFTVFLLSLSPRFFGYSLSNVVDVTFAFFFIFSIMQMYYFCRELPVVRTSRLIKISAGTLLALSVHNAGAALLHLFAVFTILNFFLYNPVKKFFTLEYLKAFAITVSVVAGLYVVVGAAHSLSTMYLEQSFIMPRRAFASLVTNLPFDHNQVFEGHFIGPDNFPTRYLAKYLFITTPTVVLISFALLFVFFKSAVKSLKPFSIFIFAYTLLFCINSVKRSYMNPDTLWAVHYCVYPLFLILAASGLECTIRHINDRYTNFVVLAIVAFLSIMPLRHILINSPFTSLYFNEISGGIHNAYAKYDLDSNFEVNKTANAWVKEYAYAHDVGKHYAARPVVVATNGNAACEIFYRKNPDFELVFKDYDKNDTTWDYFVAFCNHVPITQLRSGVWPPDTTLHQILFERKPMVAFYRNAERFREWNLADSVAMANDSLTMAAKLEELESQL